MKFKKIKFKNIYIGDIYKRELDENVGMKSIKHSDTSIITLYKKDAILLEVGNNGFVEINKLKNYLVYLALGKLIKDDDEFTFGNMILTDIYNPLSDIEYFVSNITLIQPDIEDLNYSDIKKLKKTFKKR